MKTIQKIMLGLIVLVVAAGLLVGIGGVRQSAVMPQSGADQMVNEIVLPETYPIILEGEWGPGQDCVAWNS
jgi:hypothetical protein